MKAVRITAKTVEASRILNEKMSVRLGLKERLMLRVKCVCKDPAVWDIIPKNSQLKKAWGRMNFSDLSDSFLLELLKGYGNRLKLIDDFTVEVIK